MIFSDKVDLYNLLEEYKEENSHPLVGELMKEIMSIDNIIKGLKEIEGKDYSEQAIYLILKRYEIKDVITRLNDCDFYEIADTYTLDKYVDWLINDIKTVESLDYENFVKEIIGNEATKENLKEYIINNRGYDDNTILLDNGNILEFF